MTATDSIRRWAWSAVVLALFATALGVLGWTWVTIQPSSAAFADSEVFRGNHLGAGTVDVAVGDDTIAFAAVNMAAGDVATGTLEVVNGGTLPLQFVMTASSNGGPLLDVLEVIAWQGTTRCSDTPPSGAVRWRPLVDPVPLPTGTSTVSPTTGRLAPGESSLICLRGELPLAATSAAQGQRLDLLLTVSAVHDVAESERTGNGGTS